MRLVDSSAWVELIRDSAVGKAVRTAAPPQSTWVVPTIVQLELAKWLTRVVDAERAAQVIAFSKKCVVVALDTEIALAAAEVSRTHKLATADAIVYATAFACRAELLTCDAHFVGLPGVRYFDNTSRG